MTVSALLWIQQITTCSYHQTKKVVENRDAFSNDPCSDVKYAHNRNPGTNGEKAALMHAVAASEKSDVDVLSSHVPVDDACYDDLLFVSRETLQQREDLSRTVGMAMP